MRIHLEPATALVVQEAGNLFETATAVFDPTYTYRYLLTRTWGPGPGVLFVMLNPSTADADHDDPTLRRCTGFARTLGCGALAVVNLYALRATDPHELAGHPDPIGPATDHVIDLAAAHADRYVAAWGAHPAARTRTAVVAATVNRQAARHHRPGLACLGLTKSRQPRHPLYLPKTATLRAYDADTTTKETR